MAKSTRQYVFEGMELLPEALTPFVEKRLESSPKGHWQVEVVEKVSGLQANARGKVAWDQQARLKGMITFWREAFALVHVRAVSSIQEERRVGKEWGGNRG